MKTEFKETELGTIPKDWKVKKINEIGIVVAGGTPSTKEESYYNGDIAWITPRDLSGYNFKFISKGERSITEEGLNNSSAKLMPKGSVLFSSRAPIGYVVISNNKITTNQGFKSIVCDEFISHNQYIYYSLKYNKERIESLAAGSTFKEVSGNTIKNVRLIIPPIEEQKAIAKILSDLDEKIEINRKINENLEELGQTLFKRWFIDFEFPNEKDEPYSSSGGEIIESELGKIPKGWKIGKLKEISNIICGKTPLKSVKKNFGGDIPFIKIPDMHNNIFIINTFEKLTQKGNLTQKNKLIPKGSIIVSCIATVGLVSITSQPSHTNQQINSLIVNNDEFQYYLYFLLKKFKKQFQDMASGGSATLNLNTSSFSNVELIYPNNKILIEYNNLITPIFNQIKKNSFEIQSLQQIRDSLLPKLMSGQMRVK